MITPSHIIYGWAAAKLTESAPDKPRTVAFVIGSFLPDVPIYTFFFIHTVLLGTSQQQMWDVLYFASAWVPVFTLSHSLLLWPGLILIGQVTRQKLVMYVGSAGTLHVCLDFLVHNDDAYAHFWPLTDWKFISPVSYWDPNYYGSIVSAVDTVVILSLLTWLYTRYPNQRGRIGIGIIAVLYLTSQILPYLLF